MVFFCKLLTRTNPKVADDYTTRLDMGNKAVDNLISTVFQALDRGQDDIHFMNSQPSFGSSIRSLLFLPLSPSPCSQKQTAAKRRMLGRL